MRNKNIKDLNTQTRYKNNFNNKEEIKDYKRKIKEAID